LVKHNFSLTDKIRKENNDFNEIWISRNKFIGSESIEVKDLDISLKQKKDSSPFNVVWLKNIDRLIDLLPKDFDYKKYALVDVGCGSGISTFYFYSNYRFKYYYGFDFSSNLIEIAIKNKEKYLGNKSFKRSINFELNDATKIKFTQRSVLFMFNPFGRATIEEMILNNLDYLKKSESIIFYANDHHIDFLLDYGTLLNRNDMFNLSCIQF